MIEIALLLFIALLAYRSNIKVVGDVAMGLVFVILGVVAGCLLYLS